MNTLSLHLDAYGTFIPDIRTLLYRSPGDISGSPFSAEHLSDLDAFLNGSRFVSIPATAAKLIDALYGAFPVDQDLESFLESIWKGGGSVALLLGTPGGVCPQWSRILDGYSERVPSFVEVRPGAVTDGLEGDGALLPIFVSRSVPALERVLQRRGQAIHYESADRLRRELELRGYFFEPVPDGASGTIGGYRDG